MLPGAFPDKIPSDVDFADEAVVQSDVPVAKIFGNGSLSTNDQK